LSPQFRHTPFFTCHRRLRGQLDELACRFHMSYRGRLCAFAQLTRMRVAALQLKLPCQMCCHAATVLFRCCTHPLRAQSVELACRFHKPYRGRVWDFAQPTGTRVAAQHPTLSSFLCFWREPPSTFQPRLSKARELESWPVLVVRLSPVQLLAAHTRRTEARPSSCASRGGGGRVRSEPEGCRGSVRAKRSQARADGR
jgi:hypothetical protein